MTARIAELHAVVFSPWRASAAIDPSVDYWARLAVAEAPATNIHATASGWVNDLSVRADASLVSVTIDNGFDAFGISLSAGEATQLAQALLASAKLTS